MNWVAPPHWQPECTVTRLVYDATDQVWQATFTIPAGSWEYKAALNGSWDENYGANAQRNGPNIALSLSSSAPVRFYYDHETHWVASNRNTRIVTAPGDYQSELGCLATGDRIVCAPGYRTLMAMEPSVRR